MKSESQLNKKETLLQAIVERFQHTIWERKHQQFVRDVQEYKENRAYAFLDKISNRKGETEVSSSEAYHSNVDQQNGERGSSPTRAGIKEQEE